MIIFMENHRPTCSVSGCASPAYTRSSGLCVMHYARMKKHGSTDDPRPKGYGEKRNHPLWMRWVQFKKRGHLCPEWLDFWAFVEGVSPQPENTKKLARHRENEPYGPTNFYWQKTPTREDTLAYYKAWNQKNPDYRHAKHTEEKYGVTGSEWKRMFKAQDGVCGLYGKPETARDKQGRIRRLAVDHDHATNAVRDLLCTKCNAMLGAVNDDASLLFAAIQYLAKHKPIGKVS